MIFATEPDAAAIGSAFQMFLYVSGGIGAILVAISAVYAAFFKKAEPNPNSEYVTRGELERRLDKLKDEMGGLRQGLHTVNLRIVWMSGLIANIQNKIDPSATIPPMPHISEQDEP